MLLKLLGMMYMAIFSQADPNARAEEWAKSASPFQELNIGEIVQLYFWFYYFFLQIVCQLFALYSFTAVSNVQDCWAGL